MIRHNFVLSYHRIVCYSCLMILLCCMYYHSNSNVGSEQKKTLQETQCSNAVQYHVRSQMGSSDSIEALTGTMIIIISAKPRKTPVLCYMHAILKPH